MKPLFTIIVPSYNSAAAVRDCLISIAQQTTRNFEVLFMDGGSQDGTMEMVEQFQGQFDLTAVSEKDNGIYNAINKGIAKARGQWIYILGTDDRLYAPDVLAQVAATLSATDKFVYGNVKVVGDAGWARDGTIHDGEFPLEKLLQRNICQQAVFYRAELFREFGPFREQYKVCADWDFALKCAARYEMKYIDVIVAAFYGGGTSGGGEADNFYNDLPRNLYSYFGRRILRETFRPVAWRFAKAAATEKKAGNWWRAFLFARAGKRA